MKKLFRLSLVAIFAIVNLAILAAPADAWRSRSAECEYEGENGEEELGVCCITCWFFCDNCLAQQDD